MHWGLVPPNNTNTPNILKGVQLDPQITMTLAYGSDVKCGAIKALDYFPCPNLGLLFVSLLMTLGSVSQNRPNVHKTGITQTSDKLNTRVSPQLM